MKKLFPQTCLRRILRDLLCTAAVFALAMLLCIALSRILVESETYSTAIFILAVALVARFTHGYVYGIAASLLGVVLVNTMFTYPYWRFDMSITGYPLTFAAMLVVSVCISTLTTRIKQQEALRTQVEMEKMRANLLRSVSHDLRTPLTSIVGSSSLLLEDTALSPTQRQELLQAINKDAQWLTRITENILSVTKFSGDKVRLRTEYEVVEEIIGSAIVKFHKNDPETPVTVERPEEILLAPMDATLIEQVLLNLLHNAMVHGKTTSRIHIALKRDGDKLCIRVSDDGAGIPEADLPHLFDGKLGARRDDQRNMGIGLSVCQSIICAHEGRISAGNNPSGGAHFEFWLPLKEENDGDSEE